MHHVNYNLVIIVSPLRNIKDHSKTVMRREDMRRLVTSLFSLLDVHYREETESCEDGGQETVDRSS